MTPNIRIREANARPRREAGGYVLYWMTAYRRTRWNFALQRAAEEARDRALPLVVLEELPCGHRWDCDRLHQFAIDGMRDNAARCGEAGATYVPHVERAPGEGLDLLEHLARRARLVVTDDFPADPPARMLREAGGRLDVRLEAVDSGGLFPASATERVFPTAFAFRRFLQGTLPEHLASTPDPDPIRRLPPPPRLDLPARFGVGFEIDLARLPIDHRVAPTTRRGGENEARRRMREFLRKRLSRYDEDRNHPDLEGSSGLSPWLRHGHLSAHEIAAALVEEVPRKRRVTGRKDGWWGLPTPAESFLDELVTWRELGINYASKREDYDRYESLPAWARATLEKHGKDPRPYRYSREALESAATHDPLWNAAQTQLVREGRLHNYMRMLWGKKILEWTRSPREALDIMIDLNNKYALDGRDPNSYSGIFWVLGRYDRPWGPERPVFGLVRYMSSENTARKLRVSEYVRRYAP